VSTTAFARAKLKHWGAPVPEGLKHGTNTYAAQVYGCDCRVCLPSGRRRAAPGEGIPRNERNRKLREAKLGKPVPPGVKHGPYAYKTYGCRCDICKQANRRQRKRGRMAWLASATGFYDFAAGGGEVDVIHWPPVGVGMWTCNTCGQQFPHRAPKERTIAA
jgi:hypothetical protein